MSGMLSCTKKEKTAKDTILEGTTTVFVDETLRPIIDDQIQIFESKYNAKIIMKSQSETEVIQSIVKDSSRIAIIARKLTDQESKFFVEKKLIPRVTPFAKDGIALIVNKNNKDSIIALQEVVDLMQGKSSRWKGLVFDNPNSSTARYLMQLSRLKIFPTNGVFSFKTNDEVIKFISQNSGMIGVVGLSYILEPKSSMVENLHKINVLDIKNDNDGKYYSPTQNNIAEGKYPLARELYVVNCQGYSGLGMGFASFIAGETGQRILLKSGLVPIRIPSRKIRIRNQINNDKKQN